MEIRQLNLEEIIRHKEKIINFFDRNIKKYPPCVDDSNAWYENCLIGLFQLWGFIEDDLVGIFLTVKDGNALNLFCLTGKNVIRHIKKAQELLVEFAQLNNIRYIQTLSSPALARKIYRDFDQRELVMISLDTCLKTF